MKKKNYSVKQDKHPKIRLVKIIIRLVKIISSPTASQANSMNELDSTSLLDSSCNKSIV